MRTIRIAILLAVAVAGLLAATADGDAMASDSPGLKQGTEGRTALERGDCTNTNSAERRTWDTWQRDSRALEWMTAAGPTMTGPAPSFSCLRILASWVDGMEVSEWCAPPGIARVSWTIRGGALPLRVMIGDIVVDAGDGHVNIPCDVIRDEFAGGPKSQHQIVSLEVMVEDAESRSAKVSSLLGVVSRAPSQTIESIAIRQGTQDAHFSPRPWPFRFADDIPGQPVGLVAIIRYRALGHPAWRYLTPLPPPTQSGCGYWCSSSHVNNLQPDTEYEVQGAWMWHSSYDSASGRRWAGWWENETEHDNWWRSWTTPQELKWSEVQRFRTFGDLKLSGEATSDTLRVTWPASQRTVHALAYSPDWPGVVWSDRDNSYQWRRRAELEQGEPMSALIGGLPSDTPFEVVVITALPWQFAPARPATIQIRTQSESIEGLARLADPNDIDVRFADNTLVVEWTKQWPVMYTRARLSPVAVGQHSPRRGKWTGAPTPSGLDPFDEQLTRRVQVEFADLGPGTSWRLFINRTPGHMSKRGDSAPFLCMALDIRPTPDDPEAHLDHYLFSAWRSEAQEISASHVDDVNHFWQGCELAEPTAE